MIEITREEYRQIAELLKQELEGREFYNGHLELNIRDRSALLTATLIVHYTRFDQPDNNAATIADVVPVWWEFQLFDSDHFELFNDFSFNELRQLFKGA